MENNKKLMDLWRNAGVLIVEDPTKTFVMDIDSYKASPESELKKIVGQLVNLGKITVIEMTKINRLIDSEDIRNFKLAKEILKAKAQMA